jgi:hypothetical protein
MQVIFAISRTTPTSTPPFMPTVTPEGEGLATENGLSL